MCWRPGVALLLVIGVGACAVGGQMGGEAAMQPAGVAAGQIPTPPIAADDSAADEAALFALHELEFKSLAKGGDHVRGVVTAVSAGHSSLTRPGGGTASADAGHDIDFESFATRRRVQYYVDYFVGPSRDRFNIWLGRQIRYEGMIREVFQRYGLPEDLSYLALIESGYSNTAVSRARAVGMWQFIRSTGRTYGLRIDSWVDERRDPFKATDAAARHLVDLKQQFGSWYLAAAAYNGGATRVARGIERLPTGELSDETFFDLADRRYLRRETRDYVPKLIAARIVAMDHAAHGFTSVPVLSPLVFDEFTVSSQTGLDVIASLADTNAMALRELNPQFHRGVTPPDEVITVRVPRGTGKLITNRFGSYPPGKGRPTIRSTDTPNSPANSSITCLPNTVSLRHPSGIRMENLPFESLIT
ncbi:MAG: lytic transglycosylase domain-containing protein [Gemmatimonadetes bacterium]|nr:lytic transglycosylase domain-containing protein [Gemmatimonadota bacterium]